MKLIYRGVRYKETKTTTHPSIAITPLSSKEIVYRGNSLRASSNPKFPWLSYIKQIFHQPRSQRVFDPISFWYDRKRKFLNHCWKIDEVEHLDRALGLTIQIEQAKTLKSQPKTQLKYRGVTYYR